MQLTNRKLLALHKGLLLIKDVDVDTAWEMAQNILAVEEAVKIYEQARAIISRDCGVVQGQPVTPENAKQVSDWLSKIEELKDKPGKDITLVAVDRRKIQRDKSMTPAILADLAPVIAGAPKAPE